MNHINIARYNELKHQVMTALGYPIQEPGEVDVAIIADADVHLYLARQATEVRDWPLSIAHCRKGLEILQTADTWATDPRSRKFVFSLRAELAHAEQRNANFPETLRILENVSVAELSVQQRLKIENLRALTLAALNRREEAIDGILQLFQALEFQLTTTPPQFTLDDLRSLPEIKAKEDLALLAILKTLGELIYTARPELHWPLLCTEMTLCLEKGNSPYTPQCYTDYALALFLNGEPEKAKQLSEFAIELLREDPKLALSMVSAFTLHYGMVCPWIDFPLTETIVLLEQAFHSGVESWETLISGGAAVIRLDHLRITGTTLQQCEDEYTKQIDCFKELRWEHQLPYAKIGKKFILDLQGSAEPALDFESHLPELMQAGNLTPIFLYHLNQVMFNYLMGNEKTAVAWANKGEPFHKACPGLIVVAEFFFYDALARLARLGSVSRLERFALLDKIETSLQKL